MIEIEGLQMWLQRWTPDFKPEEDVSIVPYFKFLNFWVDQDDFLEVVKRNWISHTTGNIFWTIHQKMKNTSKALSDWSRSKISNIFEKEKQLGDLEDRMKLYKAKAEFIIHHKQVDSYWRQKANIKWQLEGDENTKFFHSVVKGRRSMLHINRIQKEGVWIQGEKDIGSAVEFYQNLFAQGNFNIDRTILDPLPTSVCQEDNEMLMTIPTLNEVREAAFDINPNRPPGPDGFSSLFFKKLIFLKNSLNLPISLSNVTQKIVSKVMNYRLSKIIPNLISQNQSGFVKGRAIGENVLLAQELIHDIKNNNKGGNVVFKIDMNKAYDKISWKFICDVMRKMGFTETWIHIIWILLTNMWYSVMINGKRHGFFKSQRGVKQGDPISLLFYNCI
ncbi:uncharacterized protein LOC132637966 [Lycium barbarum]|uniref:uncharacterized protein LOC132637966 n=1 Tax=Lycium barbarum TaxID=112863 RepID=UPI00293E8012|nr:uncharacterized protein LOC132637966 [Lycium barbarum]